MPQPRTTTAGRRRVDVRVGLVASGVALLATLALAAYAWGRTPGRVPVHFDLAGRPDGWAGRTAGLLTPAAIVAGVTAVLLLVVLVDPRRANLARSAVAVNGIWVATMAVLVAVDVRVVAGATGHRLVGPDPLGLTLGLLFLVIGNYLPKLRSSWFAGVRTPWTLRSEYAWARTHRLAGRLFLVLGAVVVLAALLARPAVVATTLLAGLAVVVAVVVPYSWRAWRADPDRRGLEEPR